ncbi:STAS domain-containing protein [Streptomyces rimosus]|uniref:STAS domain-containing protein n=1 Tax=Streptomyces rimosus TaxID=1927 RepID=UPI00378955E7
MVELHGDIDLATAPEARQHVEAVTARPRPGLLVDLRPVTFFDCHGLRLLIYAQRRTLEQHGQLYLVCDAPQILHILDITGLRSLFQPAPTIARALADPVAPWRRRPRGV